VAAEPLIGPLPAATFRYIWRASEKRPDTLISWAYTIVARCNLRGFAPIDTLAEIVGGAQRTDKLQRVIALLSVRIAMPCEKYLAVLQLSQQHGAHK
jgi:hypothetical protein